MTALESRQEHTQSYYAASANDTTRYPELRGRITADVCVVGGGFTGLATALTLAERGYAVALVEANRIGWGASGRNGGQLIHGFSKDERLARKLGAGHADMLYHLGWRGHEIILGWIDRYGIQCDLQMGYVEAAAKPSHMGYLEEQFADLQRHGHAHEFRLLDRLETQQALGTERFHGGLLTMGNGHLHPLNLCAGEARAAASLGVQIFEMSPVTSVIHSARPRALTAQGEVDAAFVVLAGNAYHRLEPAKLSGLLFPAGSYIVATEPLPEPLRREINPMNVAVSDSNEILDYFRLSADGRMLYGGRCNYSGRDPRSIRAAILPRMTRVYPQLERCRVAYEWGGKIGIVLNRIPMVGRIGNNVYYAQGYSGHGVNASHILGEITADAICGTAEKFDLFARIRHFRIPGNQWFGNQMLALGMLYYRIKDWLS